MLPIKGSAYVRSKHLVLVLDTEHFAWHLVGRKRILSQDIAATSNSKNAFLLFAKPVQVVGAGASNSVSKFGIQEMLELLVM